MVVGRDEGVDLGLKFADVGRCWSGPEVLLEGLLEAFDFAAGGGMVGARVLLADAEGVEEGLESVASASAAREAGGEDHAVVGEG